MSWKKLNNINSVNIIFYLSNNYNGETFISHKNFLNGSFGKIDTPFQKSMKNQHTSNINYAELMISGVIIKSLICIFFHYDL